MVGNPEFFLGSGAGSEFDELESPEGELHLRFFVSSGNEFALPATGIREVLSQSPERMTPIPNVSPLLLGTINLRGRVIWVGDLGQFLGDALPLNTDRPEIPIVAVEHQDTILGLAVDRIVGMDWLNVDHLQMATNTTDGMATFIKGEWVYQAEEEKPHQFEKFLRLLDHVAILVSARWAA